MDLQVAQRALRSFYGRLGWDEDFHCLLVPGPLTARLASALVRVIFGPELSFRSFSLRNSPLELAVEREVSARQQQVEAYTGIWELVWNQLGSAAEHRRVVLEAERDEWFLRLAGKVSGGLSESVLESWLGAAFLPFSGLAGGHLVGLEAPVAQLTEIGVWDCILHHRCAIIIPEPAFVHQDLQGRLHNETGPAWGWADGLCGYALGGVGLPSWAVTGPIRAERIRSESNQEVRRILLERFGLENYLRELEAEVVHQDFDGAGMPRRLLLLDEEQYVEVVCPSTGRVYHLGVPLNLFRCHDAVAWTFGMSPRQYGPRIEA